MIFKQKDSCDEQLRVLERALQLATPGQERQRYEKQLALTRAGLKGEQEAAYHIDFHLRDSQNWAVIHDLRLEWNGRVAQMDHLLIDRFLEIYVVESKSFRTKIRHANGGWERLNFNLWEGIPCPVEQNQRHIAVLEELIEDNNLAPTRLGIKIRPTFRNVVVVQPSCSIMGDLPQDARVYRMDKLVSKVRESDPSVLGLVKVVAPETLHAFAVELSAYHKPSPATCLTHPGPKTSAMHPSAPPRCQSCNGLLTSAEVNYCRANSARFAACLLCRKCQVHAPQPLQGRSEKPVTADRTETEIAATCARCGNGVDRKVVAFCRFNSGRYNGRVLCRSCQSL